MKFFAAYYSRYLGGEEGIFVLLHISLGAILAAAGYTAFHPCVICMLLLSRIQIKWYPYQSLATTDTKYTFTQR